MGKIASREKRINVNQNGPLLNAYLLAQKQTFRISQLGGNVAEIPNFNPELDNSSIDETVDGHATKSEPSSAPRTEFAPTASIEPKCRVRSMYSLVSRMA